MSISAWTHSDADQFPALFPNSKRFSSVISSVDTESFILRSTKAKLLIAIGCAITSRKIRKVSESNIKDKFNFFYAFLSTFCSTAAKGFIYKFYLAYDYSDRVFANKRLRNAFRLHFYNATLFGACRDRGITVTNLLFVKCNYNNKPAWAQNEAMLEAYIDHADYFYRINDDTMMLTGGWTEDFISTLNNYDPALVGVVGPNQHGGSRRDLTYDFVHRTHVDIFGFYYPHVFTDWYADTWITQVYRPNRSTKIRHSHLRHTLRFGQRYRVHGHVRERVRDQVDHDKVVISQ